MVKGIQLLIVADRVADEKAENEVGQQLAQKPILPSNRDRETSKEQQEADFPIGYGLGTERRLAPAQRTTAGAMSIVPQIIADEIHHVAESCESLSIFCKVPSAPLTSVLPIAEAV